MSAILTIVLITTDDAAGRHGFTGKMARFFDEEAWMSIKGTTTKLGKPVDASIAPHFTCGTDLLWPQVDDDGHEIGWVCRHQFIAGD